MNKLFFILLVVLSSCINRQSSTDIVIIQASTGGTAAAIQAARDGAQVVLIDPHTWLGGMLTAAGVSGTDGNHQLPSGIWGEFRDSLVKRYGSLESLATGWVSNTLFEPSIGNEIFQNMCMQLPNLKIIHNAQWQKVYKEGDDWIVTLIKNNKEEKIKSKIVIDATDMGDVAAQAGIGYDIGMDARSKTGEAIALDTSVNIIQDFTLAAILKDYKKDAPIIQKPINYSKDTYLCSCDTFNCTIKAHPCSTMLSYGKLPNNKYMINWPIFGNDYYSNIIELSNAEREKIIDKAKEHTMGFLYYIQQELGFKNLGIADDEFPTEDKLPFIPYYREGRRIHGLTQMNMNHAEKPFDQKDALYRTGIAVGDYPIDHHHGKNAKVPKLDYVPIPSFNIPIGSLIPAKVDNFLMADKSISVTNIMNGATRLQPVVLQMGQAAGAIAAMSIRDKKTVHKISIRQIQNHLLHQKVYLMPYIDVSRSDTAFEAIQRIGATGILRGKGIPYKWANQTWFYPDSTITKGELIKGLQDWQKTNINWSSSDTATMKHSDLNLMYSTLANENLKIKQLENNVPVTKRQLAIWLDRSLDPFNTFQVDWSGNIITK